MVLVLNSFYLRKVIQNCKTASIIYSLQSLLVISKNQELQTKDCLTGTQAYSEPCQTSMMQSFWERNKGTLP